MSALFGLSLSAQALNVLAEPVKNTVQASAKFLSKNDLLMTGEIAELIIPATDTPGALAVDVHGKGAADGLDAFDVGVEQALDHHS